MYLRLEPRNIKIISVIAIILFISSVCIAQTLTIQYLEGFPFYQSATEEFELEIGDEIPLDGQLILEDGDYLEMTSSGNDIKLLQPGKYPVHVIYNNRILKPLGTGAHILNRFSHSYSNINHEVTAGVRGDKQETLSPDGFSDYFEDVDYEDYRLGMEYYEAGDFQTALRYFQEGMEWEGTNYDALYLHSVLCHFQLNNMKEVQYSIKNHTINEDSISYKEYMLFRINWQIEQFQFLTALELLKNLYPELQTDKDRQLADFLYGCCYYSLNDLESAGNFFTAAQMGPSREISEQSSIIYNSFKE